MSRKTKRSVRIAVALCVLGNGISAQENVVSPGGVLVERQLLDKSLTARETLEVFERPEREWLLPIFWTQPELAGTITEGEIVRVVGVKETYLWRDRFVWLELERRTNSTPSASGSGSDPRKPRARRSGPTGQGLRRTASRTTSPP